VTGRHISAAEALSIGLIGHVVPDGQALAKALEIAGLIAANGPVAVRGILAAMRETEGMAENDAFAVEAKIGAAVFASEDAREGPRAFAEKRVRNSATPDTWHPRRGQLVSPPALLPAAGPWAFETWIRQGLLSPGGSRLSLRGGYRPESGAEMSGAYGGIL